MEWVEELEEEGESSAERRIEGVRSSWLRRPGIALEERRLRVRKKAEGWEEEGNG